MPRDREVYEMTCWLKKTLPADELYGYSKDKLEQLAVRQRRLALCCELRKRLMHAAAVRFDQTAERLRPLSVFGSLKRALPSPVVPTCCSSTPKTS